MKNHCFLRNHGVLPTDVVCPTCNLPCRYRKEQRVVLRAVEKNRQNSVSYYTGISLQGTHLSPSKILFYVNHWLQKNWNHKTRITCLNFSTATSVDWRSFCSEFTENWLQIQKPIGGAGVIVEIDETTFSQEIKPR